MASSYFTSSPWNISKTTQNKPYGFIGPLRPNETRAKTPFDPVVGAQNYVQKNPIQQASSSLVTSPIRFGSFSAVNNTTSPDTRRQDIRDGYQATLNQLDETDYQNQREREMLGLQGDIYNRDAALLREQALREYQQFQDSATLARQRATESYGTQRSINQEDYSTALGNINSMFQRANQDLDLTNQRAVRQLKSAYSARGLTDSSFSGVAQAEQASAYNLARTRYAEDETRQRTAAETTFKRNLSAIDTQERQKFQDLDNYLKSEAARYDLQLRKFDLADYANNEQAQFNLTQLEHKKGQLEQARKELHDTLNEKMANLNYQLSAESQLQAQKEAMLPVEAQMDFGNTLTEIIESAYIPLQQKQSMWKAYVDRNPYINPADKEEAYRRFLPIISGYAKMEQGIPLDDAEKTSMQSTFNLST